MAIRIFSQFKYFLFIFILFGIFVDDKMKQEGPWALDRSPKSLSGKTNKSHPPTLKSKGWGGASLAPGV